MDAVWHEVGRGSGGPIGRGMHGREAALVGSSRQGGEAAEGEVVGMARSLGDGGMACMWYTGACSCCSRPGRLLRLHAAGMAG
jgi:hypothetical protein